ncbi:chemotaxis protein CheA [Bradyrhizobium liaoningense]|uniref:chemotaxis protein CheA n=1 Tax=Bradyrhizobium liaoningense TaxID=43992 RepID=UPI001BA85162|nr:chemotaxis protein CheA [Bradyrhizobium liaoningense]MBR0716900.1 chemotaxis protein CheA [Bradyrhizobium liaoningense]
MTVMDPRDVFHQEARELLDQLEEALLDLGNASDDRDLVDCAFRALHTIKGSGSMFGFDEVAGFVHEFETAFDRVRKGSVAISPPLVQVALAAKDHIARLIAEPGRHVADGEAILKNLRAIVSNDEGSDSGDTFPLAGGRVAAADPSPVQTPVQTWRVKFRLAENALVLGANPLLLLDELRELGPCEVRVKTDAVPPLESTDPEVCYLDWEVVVTTNRDRQAIDDVFIFIADGMELSIETVAADAADAADAPAADKAATAKVVEIDKPRDSAGAGAKGGTSVRVAAERLDELMDRVGELVIAQARLSQLAVASDDANLKSVAEEMERLASGLRDTTMGIRMVPIGSLFGRFRRLVHDLSRDLDKEVDFVTAGEETELDKTVIERLADPLVHLIRNSIDHGLEVPSRRIAAGKAARGQVRLSAVHTGSEVAISIVDDGAGLNADRIRAKAEEAGLIAPDAKVADHDLFQMVFHPGFSTAKEITALSGRGVGMDVVKRTIEGLRGRIDLGSRPGGGTTVTLRLPLTLAIIEGMLVRVGRGRYSIPLSAVEECVELPRDAEAANSGRNFLNIRGHLVPFLRLRELFKTRAAIEPHQKVVIVSAGESRVGLVVDQVIGNSQTVIKSLSKLHADVETFSGATILGDGTVALILDVAHLVNFGQEFENRLRDERIGRAA